MLRIRSILNLILIILLSLSAFANTLSTNYLPSGRNYFLYILILLVAALVIYNIYSVFISLNSKFDNKLSLIVQVICITLISPYFTLKYFYKKKNNFFILSSVFFYIFLLSSLINHFFLFRIEFYDLSLAICIWIMAIFLPSNFILTSYLEGKDKLSIMTFILDFFYINMAIYSFACILASTTILRHIFIHTEQGISNKGIQSIFGNSNILGMDMLIAVILSVITFILVKNKLSKAFSVIISICSLFILYTCNARTSIYAVILAVLFSTIYLVILFIRRDLSKKFHGLLALLIVLICLFIPFRSLSRYYLSSISETLSVSMNDKSTILSLEDLEFKNDENEFDDAKVNLSSSYPSLFYNHKLSANQIKIHNHILDKLDRILSSRLQLIKEASLMAFASPIWGFGYHRISDVAYHYMGDNSRLVASNIGSSHNIFSDALLRGGIIALINFILLALAVIRIFIMLLKSSKIEPYSDKEQITAIKFIVLITFFTFMPVQLFEITAISSVSPYFLFFWIFILMIGILSSNFSERNNKI